MNHPIEKSPQTAHVDAVELFPIRVLSKETGVGTSTLRAWERRYGLLTPERTPKGHRLYRQEDIWLVQRVLTLLQEGHSLPSIARQLKAGKNAVIPHQESTEKADVWSKFQGETLQAIADFSTERLESIFNEAYSLYPVNLITERLIEPTLVALGERWQEREAGIAEEHFYSAWIRNRLGARLLHAVSQAHGPRILCAGLPGSHHEIGMLLFVLSALNRGYRVLYLGTDLPLEQIPLVAERAAARAVVLSSRSPVDTSTENALASLVQQLKIPLLLGGPASEAELAQFDQAGGVRLGAKIGVALEVLSSHVPLSANRPPVKTPHKKTNLKRP